MGIEIGTGTGTEMGTGMGTEMGRGMGTETGKGAVAGAAVWVCQPYLIVIVAEGPPPA